jgi:hypothetical protein
VIAHRLRNQGLTKISASSPVEVVRSFGAVQAQDYPGARWALGQRLSRATDVSVAAAYDRGEIIRAHVMRPTWHFVAPEDLRWMQALTGPRVRSALGSSFRHWSLDAATLTRSRKILERALRDRNYQTRQELRDALEQGGVDTSHTHRLAFIMMDAELESLVCSGPMRGKQFTYALVDERVPRVPPRSPDDALAELTRRYFTSHGPATIRDFAWWSGLTMAQARQGLVSLGRDVSSRTVNDREYYATTGFRAARLPVNRAWLLPNYDEYFIAYKDRDLTVSAAAQRSGMLANPLLANGAFPHLLMIDGLLAGTWTRAVTSSGVHVTLKPFRPLSPVTQSAVDKAIRGYTQFFRQT